MRKNNLVFSSVGKNSQFYNYWCSSNRNYDIIICFYENFNNDKVNDDVLDFSFKRSGSKLQNFYYLFKENLFNLKEKNYERIFLVDDDIYLKTDEINELFYIMEKENLWMLQPSFHPTKSKISHDITKQVENSYLRHVNFIEITALMIQRDKLDLCLQFYDTKLVGYGIDYLFLWVLTTHETLKDKDKTNKFAIIDKITCINPNTPTRSINQLQKTPERIKHWNVVKRKMKITSQPKHQVFSIKTLE